MGDRAGSSPVIRTESGVENPLQLERKRVENLVFYVVNDADIEQESRFYVIDKDRLVVSSSVDYNFMEDVSKESWIVLLLL